jgi:hypothetical protein
MGGANTQLPTPEATKPTEDTETFYNPKISPQEQATIDRLNKQGMSGMQDESLAHYMRIGKDIYGELRNRATQLSPNLFGRDASPAASADTTQNK